MPIYEYECPKCYSIQEQFHGMNEIPRVKCTECGSKARRIVSACGWDLKGCGWYNPHNPKRPSRGGVPATHKKRTK